MPLDTLEPLLHAIDPCVLDRDLRAEVHELRLHVAHAHLDAGQSYLDLTELLADFSELRANLILPTLQSFHRAPQNLQLLHDEIGGFIDHGFNLWESGLPRHPPFLSRPF